MDNANHGNEVGKFQLLEARMISTAQNSLLNHLMSQSESFLSAVEGQDVAVMSAERDLETALLACGFKQTIKQDKFGAYYGHASWWNEAHQALVANCPGSARWTITFVSPGGECHTLSDKDFNHVQ